MYDLRNIQEKVNFQARLDSIIDASYLGFPYFQADEVEYSKSTPIDGISMQDVIQGV